MWDQSKIEWIISILKTPALRVCADASIQIPHHLISDMHELINEIPTVPIYYLVKLQARELAWRQQREKKTLLSLTLA